MSNIDTTVRELFAKLEQRKAKVAELKAAVAKSWRTNGTFRLFGATSTTNIQTASAETIEECAVHVQLMTFGATSAAARLGRPITQKVAGYSADDWFEDFQKRLAMIGVREEETQLAALETRLNSVLSPEERRRIEVEMLLKEV